MSNLTWAQSAERGIEKYENADYAGALKEFQPLAAKGHAKSQSWLGYMYFNGKGVKQDYCKAAELYQKAVNGGWLDAHVLLGDMYVQGQCVKKDYDKAFKLFQTATHKGHDGGMLKLSEMYQRGWGVNEDINEAKDLLRFCIKKKGYYASSCQRDLTGMEYAQGIFGGFK